MLNNWHVYNKTIISVIITLMTNNVLKLLQLNDLGRSQDPERETN